ncbi:hypothetical protein [Paracoccus sp. SY]|uniref:hypothetical protein n=1 Tax=Paracoccus sp. SY TaxID=1330255 RepID=UPI000CD05C79|nr:hypothetical protein [Paracoccus sp. SY]
MPPALHQSRLVACAVAAGVILSVTGPTMAQDGPPNEVAGHVTNAFMPGFPEEHDGLVRSSIQSRPQEGRIMATYGTPEDDRSVQVLLYPLDKRGIEGNIERAASYMAGGEIPVTRETVQSPGGSEMECMTSRVGELGYTFCVAEVRGRALNVQVGEVVAADASELPIEVVQRSRDLAGDFVDSIEAAPDS